MLDQPVDAVLRVALDEEVDVVGHRLQLDEVALTLFADFTDEFFEPLVHGSLDDGAAVLGAPHHVVRAAVDDVVVGPDFNHTAII